MQITVLYGGVGAERAVSLVSGRRVFEALSQNGHITLLHDWRAEMLSDALCAQLRAADAVFLALHGDAGENGTLQAALERAGIFHYTGTPPAGAALAMQKQAAKACVAAHGVRVAQGDLWIPGEKLPVEPPLVVKPLQGGSSVGLCIVQTHAELQNIPPTAPLLCEKYLAGREYTVGILADTPLPVVEIRPLGGTYDYRCKYTPGACEELCPAPLDIAKAKRMQEMALVCFRALGLRDFARVDFREDAAGEPHFLEANTLPGMTPTSLLPLAARVAGLDFAALCETMCRMAQKRKI